MLRTLRNLGLRCAAAGSRACRRIRQARPGHDPLIIALTGWGQEDDRRRSAEAGFDAHLVKPLDVDALRRLLGDA
jgi:CheY-like chemotaxis protein